MASQETFRWSNPVVDGPAWIRDAFILRVGDRYYLTGTSKRIEAPNEASAWPGFYLWSSDDLQHWKEEGLLIGLAQTKFNLAEIDLDRAQLISPKQKVFLGGDPGDWDDAEKINEGSTMLKVNGVYYYFWSCNSWGYFVGCATRPPRAAGERAQRLWTLIA